MTDISTESPEVKDFSSHRVIRFRIDNADGSPAYFDGLSNLPAMLLVEFAGTIESIGEAPVKEQPKFFRELFELILQESSAQKFVERMMSRENPISLEQVMDIMPWIMEQYGLRPILPSDSSATGSESQDGGTSSTENTQPEVLTSPASPPIDSSI